MTEAEDEQERLYRHPKQSLVYRCTQALQVQEYRMYAVYVSYTSYSLLQLWSLLSGAEGWAVY